METIKITIDTNTINVEKLHEKLHREEEFLNEMNEQNIKLVDEYNRALDDKYNRTLQIK